MKELQYKIVFLLLAAESCIGILVENGTASYKDQRIVGGITAPEGFAPYQVSLQNVEDATHFCGGAILNQLWVLTAAHCLHDRTTKNFMVVTGTNKYTKPGAYYYVERIFKHCGYRYGSHRNDIALVKVFDLIDWNNRTQPIPLPEEPLKGNEQLILTGWGSTYLGGPEVEDLQKLFVYYMPYRACHNALGNTPLHDVGTICTHSKPGQGACHGDSGGPLINNGYLVGIVNWGLPCAKGKPDVQASVYFYTDWIRSVMEGTTTCSVI